MFMWGGGEQGRRVPLTAEGKHDVGGSVALPCTAYMCVLHACTTYVYRSRTSNLTGVISRPPTD
jgi:hypothetical protein